MLKVNKIICILIVVSIMAAILCIFIPSKKTKTSEHTDQSLLSASKEFVAFRNELKGAAENTIYNYFSNDITQIIATDYYVTAQPKQYIFNDYQKILDFAVILSETHWSAPSDKWDISQEFTGMKFELKNSKETVTTINMIAWMVDCYGVVEIIRDGKSAIYEISENAYFEMRAFTTKKYYLHKSNTLKPTKEFCMIAQEKALTGLDKTEKKYVSEQLRNLHYGIELLLIENISFLKEYDSTCWELAITGHGQNVEMGSHCFNGAIKVIQNISTVIKDRETKIIFENMYTDLKQACNDRDIEKILMVHEYIHDYDYYAINYPAHYNLKPADWSGIGVYFGRLHNQ